MFTGLKRNKYNDLERAYMSAMLPILGFCMGWLMKYSSYADAFKRICAKALAWFFIPFIIIYQMINFKRDSLILMLMSLFIAVLVYAVFKKIFNDPLIALCASYVNIGWLGFPLALLIFGQSVSSMIIALYIGSSIFGNIYAVSAISTKKANFFQQFKTLLKTPAMLALILGIILHLFDFKKLYIFQGMTSLESWVKIAMILTGMAILGIWLGQTKITWLDLKDSFKMMTVKLILASGVCLILSLTTFHLFKDHLAVWFFLFCLPPAANIVALETHYQGTGRSAQYIAAGTITSLWVIILFVIVLRFLIH